MSRSDPINSTFERILRVIEMQAKGPFVVLSMDEAANVANLLRQLFTIQQEEETK